MNLLSKGKCPEDHLNGPLGERQVGRGVPGTGTVSDTEGNKELREEPCLLGLIPPTLPPTLQTSPGGRVGCPGLS